MSNKSDRDKWETGLPEAGGKSSGRVGSTETRPSPAAGQDRLSRIDWNELQISSKRGVESSSQKQHSTRHYTDPAPASTPVPGAFGKTGSLSETEDEMVNPELDAESSRRDFVAERRRQNKRARK